MKRGVGRPRPLRAWLAITLLVAAIGLLAAGAAGAAAPAAATPYVDGMSDQNVEFWNGDIWNGGPSPNPFAYSLRSTFVDAPTTAVKFARYVVAYDLMCDRRGAVYAEFRSWLRDVRALGLVPVVAFWYGNFHGNACATLPPVPRTVAQYNDAAAGVAAFLRAFPAVRTLEAWNEPNNGKGPDVPPATAAGFWAAARSDCAAGTCAVIAGDFNDAQANLVAYERQYLAALGGVDPVDWGVHPYAAVNDQETTTLSDFYGALPHRAADRVWYTEVGAYYCTASRNLQNGFTPSRLQQIQEASAHYLVTTLMAYPFTPVHVFYYEFMYKNNLAGPCAGRDSALYEPAAGQGGVGFTPRAAVQDILPFAVITASPQTAAAASADGRWVYDFAANWQIWSDPWRITSLR